MATGFTIPQARILAVVHNASQPPLLGVTQTVENNPGLDCMTFRCVNDSWYGLYDLSLCQ